MDMSSRSGSPRSRTGIGPERRSRARRWHHGPRRARPSRSPEPRGTRDQRSAPARSARRLAAIDTATTHHRARTRTMEDTTWHGSSHRRRARPRQPRRHRRAALALGRRPPGGDHLREFDDHRPRAVIGATATLGDSSPAPSPRASASADVTSPRSASCPPGVARLTASADVNLGVVISASHNAMPDNGISSSRAVAASRDAIEDEIEATLTAAWQRPVGGDVGRIATSHPRGRNHIDHLVGGAGAPGRRAHRRQLRQRCSERHRSAGAARGRRGRRRHDRLAGRRNMTTLRRARPAAPGRHRRVRRRLRRGLRRRRRRCVAVNHTGALVDGDQIVGLLATAMKYAAMLVDDTLRRHRHERPRAAAGHEGRRIRTVQTGVGDRYVLEAMRAGGTPSAGSSRGTSSRSARHHRRRHPHLAPARRAGGGAPAGRWRPRLVVTRLPQVLVNVPGVDKARAAADGALVDAVTPPSTARGARPGAAAPSGTEPLVRVMVEAATQREADARRAPARRGGADRLALDPGVETGSPALTRRRGPNPGDSDTAGPGAIQWTQAPRRARRSSRIRPLQEP